MSSQLPFRPTTPNYAHLGSPTDQDRDAHILALTQKLARKDQIIDELAVAKDISERRNDWLEEQNVYLEQWMEPMKQANRILEDSNAALKSFRHSLKVDEKRVDYFMQENKRLEGEIGGLRVRLAGVEGKNRVLREEREGVWRALGMGQR
ncbi:hypothetical protein LTR17_023532 [Elasticomyces elasticus]|nr:hypothetical protein LTR17_023532 [Elasticomyces elasticus]